MGQVCHVCGRSDVPVQREWGPFEVFRKVAICDSCRRLGESFERVFVPLTAMWLGFSVVWGGLQGFD